MTPVGRLVVMQLIECPPVDLGGVEGVAMSHIAENTEPARFRVDLAVLEAGSVLPTHRAGQRQVFAVVAGRGLVSGEDGVEQEITPGRAAVWERGERHSSRAVERMTVLIVQSSVAD